MPLQLNDLAALDTPVPSVRSSGEPLAIPLADIDEDPTQPRMEFDENALKELAATIAERGVKQPISVRLHADRPGRWMLNFGARRLRASRIAGRSTIPAFVDEAADSYDQVIENEQREGLRPLELALFVQRRLAAGESQAEIARRMGKSKQYVTFATALIDAPDWLMRSYREGRCRGLRELHELRRLHAQAPEQVESLAADGVALTRDRIERLRQSLAVGLREATPATARAAPAGDPGSGPCRTSLQKCDKATHRTAPRLVAELNGEVVEIDTRAVPERPGRVFVRSSSRIKAIDVDAALLTLKGFAATSQR